MGIEPRRGTLYYYRKRREESRVVSEYVGGGVVAILSKHIDERDREEREQEQQEQRERDVAFYASLAEIQAQFDEIDRHVNLAVKAFYLSEGYHQHKRQWRKRRYFSGTIVNGERGEMSKSMSNEIARRDDKALEGELGRLVIEAGRDQKQVPAVKAFIAAHPGIFEQVSFLGPTIQKTLMVKMFGDNEAAIMLAEGEYRALVAKHISDGSTPVEKMLVERVAMCWLRVNYAELALAGAQTLKQHEACDRALDRAQGRLLAAIETLARVRAMIAAERAALVYAKMAEAKALKRERRRQGESVTVTARVVEDERKAAPVRIVEGDGRKAAPVLALARRKRV